MNKSIKAINKKDISNSRTQYLNHIRLYKISNNCIKIFDFKHLLPPGKY